MYLTEKDLQAITYVIRTEIKTGLVPIEERLDRVEERLDGRDERLSNLEESNEEIRSATNYLLEIHDGSGNYIKMISHICK